MNEFLIIVIAGILGSGCMAILLSLIHRKRFHEGDMVRVLGSAVTRSEENSLAPGLAIHLSAGILFAFIYAFTLSLSPAESLVGYVSVCTGIGFFHGLVMSMVLMIAVAEHHPLKRYRKVGPGVAIAYLVAHVFYGAIVGLVLGLMGFSKFVST